MTGEARLAELLSALSLVTDLARGRPPEEAMRACLIATAVARSMGLPAHEVSSVYYTTLLRSIGCTATSHEYAAAFGGNDVAVRGTGDLIDASRAREALGFLWSGTGEGPIAGRLRRFVAVAPGAPRASREGAQADCEVGAAMARRFRLDEEVEAGLRDVFERWDGKGSPRGVAGDSIAVPARLAAAATAAVMFEAEAGRAGALEVLRRWSGRRLDPAIVTALTRDGGLDLDAGWPEDPWAATVAAEPEPHRVVRPERLDEIAAGFADAVDLKSPYFAGHSAGVADLAERAGSIAGLEDEQTATLRRAGLFHDLGRVGVPSGIWEKAGPLTTTEWEAVRLHPYHSERILGRSPALAGIARLAGMHHERPDGSGYHRGAPGSMLDTSARILAAADAFHALTEERPHRPAHSTNEAARTLEAGAFDADAVRAVIEAAGERPGRRPTRPAGLTERELEVLHLLVRGRSEKEIAHDLVISGSTVHTHVVHIYGKASVSTRAGLSMFAMEHDLVRPGRPE